MTLYRLDGVEPEIDTDTWIAPNATIIGKVRVHRGASVWFGAVLRGDNEWLEIGPGSNVQDNAVIHSDPGFPLRIGAECTIGHSAVVHGCTIGDRTLVGMAAQVLNGARVGSECLIGAGALVTEGREIPDGVLAIGAPAKVARSLEEDQKAALVRSATVYRERISTYRAGLSPID